MRLGRWLALSVVGLMFASGAPAAPSAELSREILTLEQSRDTGERLGELAAHEDPAVRARALRALGRRQSPDLLETLAKGLNDKDELVRLEAAFAVGELFDTVAEPQLSQALDQEKAPEVRARLIESLGKCGGTDSAARLGSILGGSHAGEAQEAALALGVMGNRGVDIKSETTALVSALRSKDPELQWRAAFATQRGKVTGAMRGLFTSLKSDDPQTLIFSARAMGEVGNRQSSEKVLPLLKNPDWRVRVEGLRALATLKARFHTSAASLLLDDRNPHVLLTAIDTMGKLASGGGLGRLGDLEQTSDWRIRDALLQAYATGRGDGALPDIKDAMKDPDPRIRAAAARAFGKVPTEQSLVVLEGLSQDESPLVQAAIVNALVAFPHLHAVEMIRPYLRNSDPAILTSAANAAGQRLDRNAVPDLLAAYEKLLAPVDVEPMVAILEALGAILTATDEDGPVGTLSQGDRARGEALLESARHDDDPVVALAAADALSLVRMELMEPASRPVVQVPKDLNFDLALSMEVSDKKPVARLITNRGTITLRLFGKDAPGTVSNFVTLAREGYYNGLTFHRVVADFVIQGGDPRGDGWGGPGYAIRCEYNPLRYKTGMVGMALSGKDTGGSQFFITHSPQPHLNGKYTIFGEVIEGMDVVDKIQVGDVINEIQLTGI